MEPTTKSTNPAIPIAIVAGSAMIAIAIFFVNSNEPAPVQAIQETSSEERVFSDTVRPIDETDYVLGNPNAPIVIIEYSDYDCPFCKRFHSVLHQVMDEVGVDGQVAWTYRQFPLAQIHPNAPKISEAALCVGKIGGNSAFWKFSDRIFETRDLTAPTNMTKLLQYAVDSGVSQREYTACINSGEMQEAVLASAEEAFNLGARGTPYTIVTVGDQEAIIDGAQSYEVVRGIVESLIDQLEGVDTPSAATTEATL
jgi:protein-disulfide isomerase